MELRADSGERVGGVPDDAGPAVRDRGCDAEVLAEVAVEALLDLGGRLGLMDALGLGHLALGRSTSTVSSGELQRLRLTTALRSGLFGVVYVLDEPSAGLHPQDTERLVALGRDPQEWRSRR